MVDYNKQQRVRIIGGKYKDKLYGTFLDYSGTKSALVKLDSDTVAQRGLWLTSIRPISTMDKKRHGTLATDGPAPKQSANGWRNMNQQTYSCPDGSFSGDDIRRAGAWPSGAMADQYFKEVKAAKHQMNRLSEEMDELKIRVNKL